MALRALLDRVLALPPVATARSVLDVYGRAAGGLLANGLAFSALFAAVPSTLLVLGLVGWLAAGDAELQREVTNALVAALPPLADLIRESVDALTDGAALASIVGVVGLIWTVGGLFGALDTAFARIYFDQRERNGLWRTARGILLVGGAGIVVVVAVVGIAVLATFAATEEADGSLAADIAAWLGSPPVLVIVTCGAVMTAYRILPPRPPRWGALLLPSIVVGVVLLVFSQAFTFLVPRLVGAAELAGSLASGFAALAWLSLSFQALLLGAAWVRVRDERGSASLERPAAPAEPGVGGQ
jgi:membrane protein